MNNFVKNFVIALEILTLVFWSCESTAQTIGYPPIVTPVSTTNGGTGIAAPAAHSLLFTNGASAMSALSAVAGGSCLNSNGVSADPIWSACGTGLPANFTISAVASATVLTLLAGKTLTFNNTLTFTGTDSTTMTFPTTSATIARTDAANTFTGNQTFATAILLSSSGSMLSNSVKIGISTAPGASTGCGTGASMTGGAGTFAGSIAIGTSPSTTCVFTMPTASHGWSCGADDVTTLTEVIHVTATTTTSVTFGFYDRTTGVATAPTASDVVQYRCTGY